MKYIEEEISLAEFAERFLGVNDFVTPATYDTSDLNVEVETLDSAGNKIYKPIQSFVVKAPVLEYYTDGTLLGSKDHQVIEDNKSIKLENHADFHKEDGQLNIVDIEVKDTHSYLANSRLHHNTTSGGKALGFHASTRVRLSQAGSIKKKDDNNSIVGINCKAKVTKSRLGPPLRTAEFEIFFDKGIDDTSSWLRFLVERGIIKQTGSHYTITDDGVEHRIQSKEWKAFLAADADRKERLYTQLCDAFVMTYKSSTDPDDMESDDEVDEVEEAPTKKKNGKKNGK